MKYELNRRQYLEIRFKMRLIEKKKFFINVFFVYSLYYNILKTGDKWIIDFILTGYAYIGQNELK